MHRATSKRTATSVRRPPFRADHVGSLLRPDRLKAAREEFLGAQTDEANLGPHDNARLRAVEDECIRAAVAMQERAGLAAVSDGEFRRRSWWQELLLGWEGFSAHRTGSTDITWRNEKGERVPFTRIWVSGPIRWRPSAVVHAFKFLKENTGTVPKVTIPAPFIVHMFGGGNAGILEGHYDDMEAFWADLVAAYRHEVNALVATGATYIQFDDTSIAFLCDPEHRATVRTWGSDPDRLLEEYADRLNEILADLPEDVAVTLHQCRGNREGHWAAEGGYDPVADVMFNRIDVDGYFLEYDTERAGGFESLRLLPEGKTVVLGIVSSKTPELEPAEILKRRIDEAARFAPLDQLAISPQCGFASSIKGNPLSEADQEAKLARLVEVAEDVWGGL